MNASVDSGGRSRLQHSQLGRSLSITVLSSSTAAGRGLDGRAFYGAEGAEDAAVSLVRLEQALAPAALVAVHARVLRHLLFEPGAAGRTRQDGAGPDFHGQNGNAATGNQRTCSLYSSVSGVGCRTA